MKCMHPKLYIVSLSIRFYTEIYMYVQNSILYFFLTYIYLHMCLVHTLYRENSAYRVTGLKGLSHENLIDYRW
jgi:hypothetical protein